MNSGEAEMNSYPALLESVSQLAEAMQDLNRRAVREYTPVVETILRTRSCDTRHIEHTLDGLLGFCGYEPALLLLANFAAITLRLIRRRRWTTSMPIGKCGRMKTGNSLVQRHRPTRAG